MLDLVPRPYNALALGTVGTRDGERRFALALVLGRAPIETIDRTPIRETGNYVARVMSALWRRTHNARRGCATWLDLVNGVWPRR